jgi:hypothetical protein
MSEVYEANELDGYSEKSKSQLARVEELLNEALSGMSPRSKRTILNEAKEIVKGLQ